MLSTVRLETLSPSTSIEVPVCQMQTYPIHNLKVIIKKNPCFKIIDIWYPRGMRMKCD